MKEFLRSIPLFAPLSDQEIELLARAAVERRFAADERIVRKDEAGDSAFILKHGAAEARIEKPGGAPLHLSRIGPGELFGELALFDDTPRSATVVATVDTTVVEIRREQFLKEVARNPDAALKLLALIAKRLRRAESIVSDFSDRIYGDVLPRLHDAVSAQLESAKVICDQAKERVGTTTDQAKLVLDAAEHRWTNLVRTVTAVGAAATVFLAVAGFFGYQSFDALRADWQLKLSTQLQQFEGLKSATEQARQSAEAFVGDLKSDIYFLRELKKSRLAFQKLQLDKLRRDLQVGALEASDAVAPTSGYTARGFLSAYRGLMSDYLGQPQDWDVDILVDALAILVEITGRGHVALTEAEWRPVVQTIEQVIMTPPDSWYERQRLGRIVRQLYQRMLDGGFRTEARDLAARLEDLMLAQKPNAAGETALILAQLGRSTEGIRRVLNEMQTHPSPWRRNQAAIALIAMGEAGGWETIRSDLAAPHQPLPPGSADTLLQDRRNAAFAAAHLLAERAVAPNVPSDFEPAALDRQLSADALARYVKPWPQQARIGMDLIGATVVDGLALEPSRRNRFYWQYSCNVLCDLGCKAPGTTTGGPWCAQCLGMLREEYFRGAEVPARSPANCGGVAAVALPGG